MKLTNLLKNRLVPYTLAIGLGASLLSGCKETRTELSDILHEDAVVSETVYTPSRHGSGSGVGPTFDVTDGNVGIAFTSININIPEKYAVVFKCQHGKFIVEGTDIEHKSLWKKLSQGQEVDISYREVFNSVYDDIDGDGKKDLVSRTLVDYDFLDAQPMNK